MKRAIAILLTLGLLLSFSSSPVYATEETFSIEPKIESFGEKLGDVSVTGILDDRYYNEYCYQDPSPAMAMSISLPLYKVTVGSNYTKIKIDYDTTDPYADQLFSSKQLSYVYFDETHEYYDSDCVMLAGWNSEGIIDWQNGKTITRDNLCNTDALYNEEKEKLTDYAKNSNATYLLAIYAEIAKYVFEYDGEEYYYQAPTAKALVLFEWENVATIEETFSIEPKIDSFGEKLGDVSVTGILDDRYYNEYCYQDPSPAMAMSISLPLYKVTVGSNYSKIKIDYDTTDEYADQLFSSKQLSYVYFDETHEYYEADCVMLAGWNSDGIIDWQNGKTITRDNLCNTDVLYNEEKDTLADYAQNSNTTYLLAIYAEVTKYVFEYDGEEYYYQAPTAKALVLFEWENGQSSPSVDKTFLQEAINSVPTLVYTGDDRFNGKETSVKGFWADMQEALSTARAVNENSAATQAEVDAAALALRTAIAKLIPTTQLNATTLYEALQTTTQYSWDETSSWYLGDYTSGSAEAFDSAREAAQNYLNGLFLNGEATDINTDANQRVADGYAAKLLTARDNLLKKELLTEAQRYRDTIVKLDTVFGGLNSDDYTIDSWNRFATDRIAAAELIEDHPANDNLTRAEYNDYASTARTYWLAVYGLRSKTAPTVTVWFSDDFGMRYPGNAQGSAWQETLTMTEGTSTLKELLTQAGLANLEHLGYSHSYDSGSLLWDDWVVYINGVLVRDPKWVSSDVDQTVLLTEKSSPRYVDWNDICVRDGDVVTLARVEAALMPPTAGVGAEGAYFESKAAHFGQLSLSLASLTANEGEAIPASVRRSDSYLLRYDGRDRECLTALLAAYGPQKEDGSWPAAPTILESGTELTLYQAGVYLVTAFEPQEQDIEHGYYPNLTVSSLPLLVTITPLNADELAEARADYEAQLDAALADCDAEVMGAAYDDAVSAVENGKEALADAASLSEMQALVGTALSTIEALKTDAGNANTAAVATMREYLKFLPSAQQIKDGKFTRNDVERMGWAGELYDSMTDYQKSLLTATETQQWQALTEAFGADGSGLPSAAPYALSISVVNGDGETQLILTGWNFIKGNEWGDTNWRYNYTGENSASVNYGEQRDDLIAIALVLPVETEEDDPLQSVSLGGAELHNTGKGYQLRNGQLYITYNFNIYNPRQDLAVVLTLPANDAISKARDAAVKELTAAYNGYSKSDYTAEKWAELTAAYNTGIAAIAAATSVDAVNSKKQTALDDMDAVQKKTAGELGSVTVIVENTTYDDTDIKGTLASATVDLTAQSTMMKCVLTVLEENGYTWTGTGGTGYEITYLASVSITKDGVNQSLGEFGAGPQSGWMGTLNDWFVNAGFDTFTVANGKLKDGDVIRVQYTVAGYGTDLGATWANNDTSLKELNVDGGGFGPKFESSVLEYVLSPEGGSVSLQSTATNKNFQVRIFLNQQNKNTNADYYRSDESIPVKSGDVIWIGVGEKAWGTMNDGSIVATWYKLNVVSKDDANAVVKLINAIGSVNYSNYKDKQASVDLAGAAYDALTNDAKAKVGNYATLTKAEALIEGYQNVGALKEAIAALPKVITEADSNAVAQAEEDYETLKKLGLDSLLAVAETNKLLKAVNTLTLIDELKAIGATKDFVSTEANTEADVMAALRTWLTGQTSAKDEDVIISITGFTDANSSRDGSYTATVSFTLGSGSQAATQKKTISGTIKRSSDAGVSKIVINGKTTASGSDTSWTATLPYGSDPTKATFAITAAGKATPSAPVMAKADGSEWTFTVTAEDGTKKDYTVKLSVSEVKLAVLDSNVYDVSDDTVVTALSPVAVSGLDAIVADDLDLPEGTKEASVWLMLKIKAQSSDELTLAVTAWYAADGKEAAMIPDDVLKNVELTLTVPLAGTEYAKVLYDSAYLDAKGSSSGITFDMAAAGDYTLIPDAHIAIVTFHEFDGTNNRQIVFYRGDAGEALPAASKSGAAFKGWYAKADCTGDKFTTVSATLPTDLYPLWSYGVKTEEVGDIEDRVEVSAIVQGDVATITVESKKPCAVIVEKPDGSFERLEAFDNGDGSCSFVQEDYDADMVFYVATLGDYDENGVLETADLTAANLTIIGDVDLEPLSAFIMGAKDGKLRTVDLAKLFLHLARNDVEW